MATKTKIEWCDHTFNPWRGCTKVAEGCKFCYADALSKRNPNTLGVWGPDGTRVMAAESYWREPIKWNREAEAAGERRRVFCASLADVFEDWTGPVIGHKGEQYFKTNYGVGWFTPGVAPDVMRPATMDDLRIRLFALIDATPWLDWLLLTKRPENILKMWPLTPCADCGSSDLAGECTTCRECRNDVKRNGVRGDYLYRRNVWLLTSIACQEDYDRNRWPLNNCRRLCPAIGYSAEPLIEPIDFGDDFWETGCCVDWVIVGGESGHHARPMHPDWARSIRDHCQTACVPFFFKQWGEWAQPGEDRTKPLARYASHNFPSSGLWAGDDCNVYRVGKKAAGRLLDGREWNEYPNVKASRASERIG